LVNLGFNVEDIGNYTGANFIENTIVYKNSDRNSDYTINLLKAFINIDEVLT
jgi:hypothetical protein